MPSNSSERRSPGSLRPPASELPPQVPDHELLRRIGLGSYGEVWLARNVMGTYRAVKVIYRHSFDHERPYAREFDGIRKFEPISRRHESQMDILQVGRNDGAGYFYYVMELADGVNDRVAAASGELNSGNAEVADPVDSLNPATYTPRTLRHELHQRGRLPFEECISIGLALTKALEHLHGHKLVHRDIKASNIIFADGLPKLADIGLVANLDQSLSLVGTTGYVAPEGAGTPQADIYSLGKVLYEMGFGQECGEFPQLPPTFETFADRHDLLELNAVLLKACEHDPQKRYQSAGRMHADLELLRSGRSVKRLHLLEKRLAIGRKLGVALAGVALLASLISYQSWKARLVATQAQQETAKGLSRLLVNEGIRFTEEDDAFSALLSFTKALELDTADPSEKATLKVQVGSVLSHCPKPVNILLPGGSPVFGAQFAPDGRHVLTMSKANTVDLWQLPGGERRQTLPLEEELISAAFSPDSQWVVTTTGAMQAQIWSADNGQPRGHSFPHFYLNSGRITYYGCLLGTNTLSFLKTGRFLWSTNTIVGQENLTLVLALSTHGENLHLTTRVLDSAGNQVFDRNWIDGPSRNHAGIGPSDFTGTHVGTRVGVALGLWSDPSSSQVDSQVVYDNLEVRVYESGSSNVLGRPVVDYFDDNVLTQWYEFPWDPLGHLAEANQQFVVHRGYSPRPAYFGGYKSGHLLTIEDGRRIEFRVSLIAARSATAALVVEVRPQDAADRTSPALWRSLNATLSFSPDGRRLVCRSSRTQAQFRQVPSGPAVGSPLEHENELQHVAFSPDGNWIITAADSEVRLWHSTTGQPFPEVFDHGEKVADVQLNADGQMLAVLGGGELSLWNIRTGERVSWPTNHSTRPSWFSLSPDGSGILLLTANHKLQYLDLSTGERLLPDLGFEYPPSRCGFSPDRRAIITTTENNLVHLHSSTDGKPICPPLRHSALAGLPHFSSDGDLLLTVDPQHGAWVWDLTKIAPLTLALPPTQGFAPIAYSPGGRYQVALENGEWHLVDNRSNETQLFPSSGILLPLKQLVFTADSRYLIAEAREGTARVFDVPTGLPLTPELRKQYELPSRFPRPSLPRDERPVSDLQRVAEVLAASRINEAGATIPIDGTNLLSAWEQLRELYPEDFNRSPKDREFWHEANAARCEQDWDWWGALFHLKRLVQLRPTDISFRQRLVYAQQALERTTRSAASRHDKLIPPRPLQATSEMLDLSDYYSLSLREALSDLGGQDTFSNLPNGIQTFTSIRFDVRGAVRLGGSSSAQFPTNVVIPVNRTCLRIHFLHAADRPVRWQEAVALYVIHFADGSMQEIPVRAGAEILAYHSGTGGHPSPLQAPWFDPKMETAWAWAGANPETRLKNGLLCLYRSTWNIPDGARHVTAIELRSGSARVAPMVVAITVEGP